MVRPDPPSVHVGNAAGQGYQLLQREHALSFRLVPWIDRAGNGGNPATTGIYYDDTWNHRVFPAGTTNCVGSAPSGEVAYTEADDVNLGALDAGQGIVPAPGQDPWANILQITGNPVNVINPANLPVDPATCEPIYPNKYLQVNTISRWLIGTIC